MSKYNHAVTLAFEIISDNPDGEDITSDMIKEGLQRRIENLDSSGQLEWLEAVGAPYDTYEI